MIRTKMISSLAITTAIAGCAPGFGRPEASNVEVRSAIIIDYQASGPTPAIALVQMRSYHPTVSRVELDTNRAFVSSVNAKKFPMTYVVTIQSIPDTIGYVYSRWNPYFAGTIQQVAADKSHGYTQLDATIARLLRGAFERRVMQ